MAQAEEEKKEPEFNLNSWTWLDQDADVHSMPEAIKTTRLMYAWQCHNHEETHRIWTARTPEIKKMLNDRKKNGDPHLHQAWQDNNEKDYTWHRKGVSQTFLKMQPYDLRAQKVHVLSYADFEREFTKNPALSTLTSIQRKLRWNETEYGKKMGKCYHARNLGFYGFSWDGTRVASRYMTEYMVGMSDTMLARREELEDEFGIDGTDSSVYRPFHDIIVQDCTQLCEHDLMVARMRDAMLQSQLAQHIKETFCGGDEAQWKVMEFTMIRLDCESQEPSTTDMHSDYIVPPCMSFILYV